MGNDENTPQIGANILDKSHLLVFFSKIVLHHHERYGLNGKEIPLGLRIICLLYTSPSPRDS